MGRYILALDQGTTSSRAILFGREGHPVGIAQREFRQIFPQPGWVEHDAKEIWESQLAVAHEVLRDHTIAASDIEAIGIANQRETTVVWHRDTGEPIANAIVWQDRRTAGACDALRAAGHAALVQARSGLVLDAYFSATKLQWLLDHTPGARALAERGKLAFGTVDSWLAYKLCGRHVTDASNAARTMLFDIRRLQWDEDLLALFNVPASVLPEIVPSCGEMGSTHTDLFGRSIPISGMAGDQQAATFGQACHSPGMAKNTYGTGCFMLMHTGAAPVASANNLLSTVGWSMPSTEYMLEGSVFMGGATVQWLRDSLGIVRNSADVERLAQTVPDAGGVMFVPAFTGLGAPYWDPYARATLIGMTRGTTAAHIGRAALEGIAHQSADLLDAMQGDSSIALRELRVDGGASQNNLLMQIQADLLGVPVIRPAVTETTALGAAYLAGLATGFWTSREEIAAQWSVDRQFDPAMHDSLRSEQRQQWQRAVDRSRAWSD